MKNVFESGKKVVRNSTRLLLGQLPSPDEEQQPPDLAAAAAAASANPNTETPWYQERIEIINRLLAAAADEDRKPNHDEWEEIDAAAMSLLAGDYFPSEAFEHLTEGQGDVLEFIKTTFGNRDKIYPTMTDVLASESRNTQVSDSIPVSAPKGIPMADIAVVLLVYTNVLQTIQRDFGCKLKTEFNFRQFSKYVAAGIFTNNKLIKLILMAAGDKLVAPKEGGYEHERVASLTDNCLETFAQNIRPNGTANGIPGTLKGKQPAPWYFANMLPGAHAPNVQLNTITPARAQAPGRQQQQEHSSDPNESSPESIKSSDSPKTMQKKLTQSAVKASKDEKKARRQQEQLALDQAQALSNNTLATRNLTETNGSQHNLIVQQNNQLEEQRKKTEAERKEKEEERKKAEAERKEKEELEKKLKEAEAKLAAQDSHGTGQGNGNGATENLAPERATDGDLKAEDAATDSGARTLKTTTARSQSKTTTSTGRSQSKTTTTTARSQSTNTAAVVSRFPSGAIVVYSKLDKVAVVEKYTSKNVSIYTLDDGKKRSVNPDNIIAFDRTFHSHLPATQPENNEIPEDLWPEIWRR